VLTNPWLNDIAKETLLFRHFSFSEKSHLTITRIFIGSRSNPSYDESSAQKPRLLTRTPKLNLCWEIIEYEFQLIVEYDLW